MTNVIYLLFIPFPVPNKYLEKSQSYYDNNSIRMKTEHKKLLLFITDFIIYLLMRRFVVQILKEVKQNQECKT